jgi:site-specific DNA-methyltransferase (adenine-specific)
MKAYYSDASVMLYHGDCREIVPQLAGMGRRFAAAIADPPYGETSLEWDTWPAGWPRVVAQVTDQLWCFGSLRMFMKHAADLSDWKLAQDVVWEKHNGSSLHNDRFRKVHELAAHFYRGEWAKIAPTPPIVHVTEDRNRLGKVHRSNRPQHFGGVESGAGYEYDGTRLQRSVIYARSCHHGADHPTQKPEAILRPLLEYSTKLGDSVLDPTCGSGSLCVVAKHLGRTAVGIEGDEREIEKAARRCCQELAFA